MDKATELKRIDKLIARLEAKHPNREERDWMPWATNDDPLAVEHWKLVQERIDIQRGRSLSPEQRKAAGDRLAAVRKPRDTQELSVLAS